MIRCLLSVPVLALSLTTLGLSGCSRPLLSNEVAETTTRPHYADPTADTWSEIKDFGYNQRMGFSAGLERMAKTKEAEFESLRVKRDGLSLEDSAARKQAEQHFQDVRIDLRLQLARLRVSPIDAWQDQKTICVETWSKLHHAFASLQRNRFP